MRLSLVHRILLPSVLLPVVAALNSTNSSHIDLERRAFVPGTWLRTQPGSTGISVMMLAVTSESTAIFLDKAEENPLTVTPPGGAPHAAWSAEINLDTQVVRPLNALTNTWCATGSFLSNGTFISLGGNPMSGPRQGGLQGVRLFTPCPSTQICDIFEMPDRVRLHGRRWYPSSVRLQDGSVMIYGGSIDGSFTNFASINNPTYEFYPPKNIHGFNGLSIPSPFLVDTLRSNHFPIMSLLPDGRIFVAANRDAMILNWQTNTETRLPQIPNRVRVSYPFSAGNVLLPMGPWNGYKPEIMICGGSTISDTANPATYSAQVPASDQCARMVLTPAGIAAGWQVERMPQARVMPELIHLPDRRILIVNGAQTGVAATGSTTERVGECNADNPAFTPVVYDPAAPAGSRFSSAGIPASPIPRMYHAVASLTPNGSVLLAGSNPNNGVTQEPYPTEYRLEYYYPPYMSGARPTYIGLPEDRVVNYNEIFRLSVQFPTTILTNIDVVLIDLGFATHGVHMDTRFVSLSFVRVPLLGTLVVTGPPNSNIYPPGPAYLYLVVDGVPSVGRKVIIGTGAAPPVDLGAIANLLSQTSAVAGQQSPTPTAGEASNLPTAFIPAE